MSEWYFLRKFPGFRHNSCKKETNRLLSTVNALSEENYRKVGESQKAFAKANHDFRHHLTAIRDLAVQKNYDGTLDNRFQNGEFISSVYLNFPREVGKN